MTDNPFIHALYTAFAVCVDNVSTCAAVVLFTLQFVILAPKAYKTVKGWFKGE